MAQTQDTTVYSEARSWLKELDGEASFGYDSQETFDAMIDHLSDQRLEQAIDRHYDGGWDGFLAEYRVWSRDLQDAVTGIPG